MEQNQALSVLVDVARFAQSKGIFTLQQAATISEAVGVFVKEDEDTSYDVEEVDSTDSVVTQEEK